MTDKAPKTDKTPKDSQPETEKLPEGVVRTVTPDGSVILNCELVQK